MKTPFRVEYGHDGKWFPESPYSGFGYYSGHLNPQLRFEDRESALIATEIANRAFNEGYTQAQYDIRKSLGLEK